MPHKSGKSGYPSKPGHMRPAPKPPKKGGKK